MNLTRSLPDIAVGDFPMLDSNAQAGDNNKANETHNIAFETVDPSQDAQGAWGSSSYAESVNSTSNLTTDEMLKLLLGPKQVRPFP